MISLLNLIVTAIIQCRFTAHPSEKCWVNSSFISVWHENRVSSIYHRMRVHGILNRSQNAPHQMFDSSALYLPQIASVCWPYYTLSFLFLHVECEMWNVIAACVARFYALSSARETFLNRFFLLCRIFWMEFPCVN